MEVDKPYYSIKIAPVKLLCKNTFVREPVKNTKPFKIDTFSFLWTKSSFGIKRINTPVHCFINSSMVEVCISPSVQDPYKSIVYHSPYKALLHNDVTESFSLYNDMSNGWHRNFSKRIPDYLLPLFSEKPNLPSIIPRTFVPFGQYLQFDECVLQAFPTCSAKHASNLKHNR